MQTRFSDAQRRQPMIAEADDILRKCVHCGFCTATCPTFVLTGDERDSPRGRIWMIRDMLEAGTPAPAATGYHLDRCLTCLSCMTTCPSGVDYAHLVDAGRQYVNETRPRAYTDWLLRRLLVRLVPFPRRMRLALTLSLLAVPFVRLLPSRLRAMVESRPRGLPKHDPVGDEDAVLSPTLPVRGRVILLQGCAQRVIEPEINAATIRLLNRLGVEVVVRVAAGCCGGLAHHSGETEVAEAMMKQTIRDWAATARQTDVDAIVINTSGCGTTIKDYGHYFAADKAMAEDAALVSDLAMDISEYLDHLGLEGVDPAIAAGMSVAYHSACSLQHGQKLREIPKNLLRQAGFSVREITDSHLCCGSAGIYNILQPELAGQLKTRKLASINAAGAELVAAGNIGCINQLKDADAPVLHTVQLLDWATGGPAPKSIERLATKH